MEVSDAALVEQSLAGRDEAFEELVRRHQDSVFNLLYRMCNSHAEAADVTQEAFVRAYRKLSMFRADRSFRNWVMTIGANLARNRFRRYAHRRTAEDRHAQEREIEEGAPDPRMSAVDEALAAMPEKWRVPLVLRYIEGMSCEEIAGVLRMGVSAVKMRVKRGRDHLAAELTGGWEEA